GRRDRGDHLFRCGARCTSGDRGSQGCHALLDRHADASTPTWESPLTESRLDSLAPAVTAAGAPPTVEISELTFAYRAGRPVLDIPSLRIDRGRRVFLFGPSGSGKTTLLGILAGVLDV